MLLCLSSKTDSMFILVDALKTWKMTLFNEKNNMMPRALPEVVSQIYPSLKYTSHFHHQKPLAYISKACISLSLCDGMANFDQNAMFIWEGQSSLKTSDHIISFCIDAHQSSSSIWSPGNCTSNLWYFLSWWCKVTTPFKTMWVKIAFISSSNMSLASLGYHRWLFITAELQNRLETAYDTRKWFENTVECRLSER